MLYVNKRELMLAHLLLQWTPQCCGEGSDKTGTEDVGNQEARTQSGEVKDNNGSPLRKRREAGGLCNKISLYFKTSLPENVAIPLLSPKD